MLMLMLYVDVSLDCCFEGMLTCRWIVVLKAPDVCCTIGVAIRKLLMLVMWVLNDDVD